MADLIIRMTSDQELQRLTGYINACLRHTHEEAIAACDRPEDHLGELTVPVWKQ